ncbi:cytochrome c [Salinihabitans flavidus]|uniref:Cytochrome c n=1 Tax=Salinihabitans flavidus TaxID=569882 RepID=A0A1H8W7B6_9RHOB|nr:cytochrome C [Salinihabitans flavidus]SEP23028.1 cytochrome c [Salinihabitans flavidus]
MKTILAATATLAFALPAFAQGDAEEGESEFRKCKSCHMIESPEGETIVRGGRTGPNLYGIIGQQAGTVEDFRYSNALEEAGENGLVWDEENLAEYVADPRAFLKELGTDGRTKMTFKLRDGGDDVAAYLATFSSEEE